MNCNNNYCLWNYRTSCCHESEKKYREATPNNLDCPSSLRVDFEQQLRILADECSLLLDKRNMKELIEIKKFIESQRL